MNCDGMSATDNLSKQGNSEGMTATDNLSKQGNGEDITAADGCQIGEQTNNKNNELRRHVCYRQPLKTGE